MSVYLRPSGIYRIDFKYKCPITGQEKRFRRSSGSRLKREAEALERQWRAEAEKPPPTPEQTKNQAAFSGFAKHWYDLHVVVNLKPTTARGYEQTLRVHLVPYFGDRNLRSITVMDIEEYKALKVKKLAPKTVNNHLGILSMLFRKAVVWRYADANPVTGIGLLKPPPTEMEFWVPEQSDAFLGSVLKHRPEWYPFFLCALRTGMRLGELLALQWGDLDFKLGQINIRRSYSHDRVTTPKSGKGRVLPMSPELQEALLRHRHLKGDLVFSDADGQYLRRSKVKHPFWTCIRLAGVKRIRIHDLRHTFASQLVMKGVPLRGIQELLGHSDISMTMRYAHLAPGVTHNYVGLLDGGASEPAGGLCGKQRG